MAEIRISELVDIIRQHPDYRERWEKGADAAQALYIRFADGDGSTVESQVFEAADGSELVIDVESSGKVRGVEIV